MYSTVVDIQYVIHILRCDLASTFAQMYPFWRKVSKEKFKNNQVFYIEQYVQSEIFKRPGVAGAVLQTPSLLIN